MHGSLSLTVRFDIYTDGSFAPASQRGGWAFVAVAGNETIATASGHFDGGTNNTLELFAVLKAAEWANANAVGHIVTIWSDSHHVVEGCNRWRPIWKNSGWRRYSANPKTRKRPLPDASLWQRLDAELAKNAMLNVAWCKGHQGNDGNERADALAGAAKDLER